MTSRVMRHMHQARAVTWQLRTDTENTPVGLLM